jgi:hypothetical protein
MRLQIVKVLFFSTLLVSCGGTSATTSNDPGQGTSSEANSQQAKPTWKSTGSNPMADLNEAPFVQTACDISREDLLDALGDTNKLEIAINTLRELEQVYGLDAKEAANNLNLTYQRIWTGISLIIDTYDEDPVNFRFPISKALTDVECESFNFTVSNEAFSSRNDG